LLQSPGIDAAKTGLSQACAGLCCGGAVHVDEPGRGEGEVNYWLVACTSDDIAVEMT
jgi:hypothetical protein